MTKKQEIAKRPQADSTRVLVSSNGLHIKPDKHNPLTGEIGFNKRIAEGLYVSLQPVPDADAQWLVDALSLGVRWMPREEFLSRKRNAHPMRTYDFPLQRKRDSFRSLVKALEGYWDTLFNDLPPRAKVWVLRDFGPGHWDDWNANTRKSLSEQRDYQHDPAKEQERKFWWDFFNRKSEIEQQVETWKTVATPTASDLAQKESRLAELQKELAVMERQERASGIYVPQQTLPIAEHCSGSAAPQKPEYIHWLTARETLVTRWDTTPQEIAIWVWLDQVGRGLRGYRDAHANNEPQKFSFPQWDDDLDFLTELMHCSFLRGDLKTFIPSTRYLTFPQVVERWKPRLPKEADVVALLEAQAKIGGLESFNSLTGRSGMHMWEGTKADFPEREAGVFSRPEVEAIEVACFGLVLNEESPAQNDGAEGESSSAQTLPDHYIAYPKAMKLLTERLNATPDEMAAWVKLGPKNGGIAAYLNANELDPPPRFYYSYTGRDDFDYLSPLMACWFGEDDIAHFEPRDRYITGARLIERWSKQLGIRAEAFIRAKIAESRLVDLHPIYGATQGQGMNPRNSPSPPMTSGLFALSAVKKIEAEDFGEDDSRGGTTAKGERECKEWLYNLMKKESSPPNSKRQYEDDAIAKFNVSHRGFERSWREAVVTTGSTAWSKPGRKSQQRINTPKQS